MFLTVPIFPLINQSSMLIFVVNITLALIFNSSIVLIFSQKKALHIFSEMEPCTFQPKLEKEKITYPGKISYILRHGNSEKFFYIFSKEGCSYVSGSNFQSSKNEKTKLKK